MKYRPRKDFWKNLGIIIGVLVAFVIWLYIGVNFSKDDEKPVVAFLFYILFSPFLILFGILIIGKFSEAIYTVLHDLFFFLFEAVPASEQEKKVEYAGHKKRARQITNDE